jgi:radical SAM superfamily enzyme YgiQ (UPF0313 family)
VAPPLGLITVAALLPADWNVRLVDRNNQTLRPRDIAWADMVMTGGMLPQRRDTLTVIELCKALGKPSVCGGPDATASPEIYDAANFLVLGEAEGILDAFISAWRTGQRAGRFQAEKFRVDVSKTPRPRFDLLDFRRYLYVGVQFSRGCPFNCEFCDIIELYGRVPRTKDCQQMLAELQALHDLGYRGHVDFVDDNLIGNKKALRQFLPALQRWQAERGYPFAFSTEASINLADDRELMAMMVKAKFFAVFVGIESPEPVTLVAVRKKQNTRRSLPESVHRINAAGMGVVAGFIVGFDTEQDAVAQPMIDLIETSAIPACMVGLLTALPGTQLSRRLAKEGRLLERADLSGGDQCTVGLNFVPLRSRRSILEDYRQVISDIYRPRAYFDRVRTLALRLGRDRRDSGQKASGGTAKSEPIDRRRLVALMRLMFHLTVRRPNLARLFWRNVIDTLRHNPAALEQAPMCMALYLHLGSFSRYVLRQLDRQIAELAVD